MNTNSKNHPVWAYLMSCIPSTQEIKQGWDIDAVTDAERVKFVRDCYKSEYSHGTFTEWMQGLPSAFNVDFENYRIIELAKEWGSIPQDADDRAEDKILDNWWNFIGTKFMQLARKHNVRF